MPKAVYGFRLDDDWKLELGEHWETINQRFYSKLANKVLVGYAPTTNKNLTFAHKMERRDGIGGADNYSTKWIVDNCSRWNLEALEARTKFLRSEILELYKLPRAMTSQKIKDKYGDSN